MEKSSKVRSIEILIHEIEYDPFTKKTELLSGRRMEILNTKLTPLEVEMKLKKVL